MTPNTMKKIASFPKIKSFRGRTTYPLAEAVARRIHRHNVVETDEVTKELYGYAFFSFAPRKAEAEFRALYALVAEASGSSRVPNAKEVEAAMYVMEATADPLL